MPNSIIDLDKRTRMPIQEQKKSRVRLVVADDNKEVRDKVVQLLRPDFDVIGTAGDGGSAAPTRDRRACDRSGATGAGAR